MKLELLLKGWTNISVLAADIVTKLGSHMRHTGVKSRSRIFSSGWYFLMTCDELLREL